MTSWTPRVGFDIRAYPNLVAHHSRIADRDALCVERLGLRKRLKTANIRR
jgi:hypothetical protein